MEFPPTEDLYPWYKIFLALSVPQFEFFWQRLKFPFHPTDGLRHAAYDFAYRYVVSINLRAKEIEGLGTRRLLETIDIEASLREDINQFSSRLDLKIYLHSHLHKTFVELEEQGYSREVYQWGIKTYTYNRINNIQYFKSTNIVSEWILLFRRWAATAWIAQKQPILPDTHSFFDLFQKTDPRIYQNIPIKSDKTLAEIQQAILTNTIFLFGLSDYIEGLLSQPQGVWETFAVSDLDTWLSLELHHSIERTLWDDIMSRITDNEKSALQRWGATMNLTSWPT